MCHFSYHSGSSHLPGLYFFSSLPVWQWRAAPRLSALNHRDKLEPGCTKMVVQYLPPKSTTGKVIYKQQFSFPCSRKWWVWIERHSVLLSVVYIACMVCHLKWLGDILTGNKEADPTLVHSYVDPNIIQLLFKSPEMTLLTCDRCHLWPLRIYFSGYYIYRCQKPENKKTMAVF